MSLFSSFVCVCRTFFLLYTFSDSLAFVSLDGTHRLSQGSLALVFAKNLGFSGGAHILETSLGATQSP
jgi:hypothetical protein